MKAIRIERFGPPAEVLQIAETLPAEPARGEVRVRMKVAPINPSDLMTIRGEYGRRPELPAVPGYEGYGVIDAVGGGLVAWLRGLKPGRRVAVLHGAGGTWQQNVVISARQVVPLPDDIPDEQAASFFINPATVLAMTQRVLRVPRGAWLLQTAAGSALGKMVIRLGRHLGFKTLNLVRRASQISELKNLGADEVVALPDPKFLDRVRYLTGEGVPYALDCVGGEMGLEAARALGPGGRLLLFGTLSGEPIVLPSRVLIGGQKSIEGFWLSDWVKSQSVPSMLRLFREIVALLRKGVLTTPVQETFEMSRTAEAVRLAESSGRAGKVLLRLDG